MLFRCLRILVCMQTFPNFVSLKFASRLRKKWCKLSYCDVLKSYTWVLEINEVNIVAQCFFLNKWQRKELHAKNKVAITILELTKRNSSGSFVKNTGGCNWNQKGKDYPYN